MVDLALEIDEGIVLQATDVKRYGFKEFNLDEMVLTNKNIICIYEKSNGLFSKSETVVEKIPLSTIRIVNNKSQVMIFDNEDYGKGLQVLFVSGHREHFIFCEKPKKTMPIWINEINKILVGKPVHTETLVDNSPISSKAETKEKKGLFGGLAGVLNIDIQSTLGKAQEKIGQFANQIQGEFSQGQQSQPTHYETAVQPQVQPPIPPKPQENPTQVVNETASNANVGKVLFCSNCGTKLNEGSKFCHGCGSAVGTIQNNILQVEEKAPPIPPTPKKEETREGFSSERRQEYVGKVLKCPNCGAVISERTAICPECGMEITGKVALSSVQAFKEQLMEIESTRKHGYGKMFSFTVDPADMKKLSLIRNFPIPNSVDDIVEFMLLAVANIEVSLSKQTAMNKFDKWGKSEETSATIATTISDAWVSKMEQVYKKAEISFPNDPAFVGIQQLYFDKLKELKIKVK